MMNKTNIHPVDIHVGTKLRQQRLSKGLSQDELGKRVKITFQQIQKYERGLNRVSSSKLYEFAKILGVKIEYFFSGFSVTGDYEFNDNVQPLMAAEDLRNAGTSDPSYDELNVLNAEFSKVKHPLIRKKILELISSIAEDDFS